MGGEIKYGTPCLQEGAKKIYTCNQFGKKSKLYCIVAMPAKLQKGKTVREKKCNM